MAVRPELRWVLVTVAVVGVLLGISALALTNPDVVWREGTARCPHCGAGIEPASHRCRTCREEYAWTVAPDEDSPISRWSLSPLEEQVLRDRVKALGRETATARVAEALSISPESASAYLEQVGVGRCGWCGGTGKDLSGRLPGPAVCPACLGRGRSIACDGDRRVRLGDPGAGQALSRYVAHAKDTVSPQVPLAAQREEIRRLTDEFVAAWHGTEEASRAWFWPLWDGRLDSPLVVVECRKRLDAVLRALEQ